MKISIVIPCYNAEKYIKECLNSCLLASHEMIEVICVDDGSTDNTKSIIDSYYRTYTCVRSIVHKENLGTLEARRSGSLAATGDYILYLDPDDLLELKAKIATSIEIADAVLLAWRERELMVSDLFSELGQCCFLRTSVKIQRIVLGVLERIRGKSDELANRRSILTTARKLLLNKGGGR